jgi:hypothetical protein
MELLKVPRSGAGSVLCASWCASLVAGALEPQDVVRLRRACSDLRHTKAAWSRLVLEDEDDPSCQPSLDELLGLALPLLHEIKVRVNYDLRLGVLAEVRGLASLDVRTSAFMYLRRSLFSSMQTLVELKLDFGTVFPGELYQGSRNLPCLRTLALRNEVKNDLDSSASSFFALANWALSAAPLVTTVTLLYGQYPRPSCPEEQQTWALLTHSSVEHLTIQRNFLAARPKSAELPRCRSLVLGHRDYSHSLDFDAQSLDALQDFELDTSTLAGAASLGCGRWTCTAVYSGPSRTSKQSFPSWRKLALLCATRQTSRGRGWTCGACKKASDAACV